MNSFVNATASNQMTRRLGPGFFSGRVVNDRGNIRIHTGWGNDRIRVTQTGPILHVAVNGENQVDIDTRKAKQISINGGFGNDRIQVDKSVTTPLSLNGGFGNDRISANNPGTNQITGGPGYDRISAKTSDSVGYGAYLRILAGYFFRSY